MLGLLGPSLGLSQQGGGGGASIQPLGSTFTSISDGTGAEGSASGLRNYVTLALMGMSGRIIPSELHNVGRSGDDMDLEYARLPYATGQGATILMRGSAGHNDGLMNTDPAGAPGIALMAKWTRNCQWILDNALSSTKKIILATTIGSLVAGESTYAAAVNAAQVAWINAKVAADARVVLWDAWPLYNHTNCTSLSPSSDVSRVHPDNRGGWQLAFGDGTNPGLQDILDGLVTAATIAEVNAWLDANTTNFDTDILLSGGTAGTLAGTVLPTGTWPTGKRITNNMTNGTAVAVACSIPAQSGYNQAKAVASGTPAATATVVLDDTANITFTSSTPGQYYAPVTRFKLDDGAGGGAKGLVNFGYACGNFASISNTTDQSAVMTGDLPTAIDWIVVAQPNPTFGSSGPMAANPTLTIRARASTVQDWEATIEKPRIVRMFPTARAVPCPVWKAIGLIGANYVQRLTGTFSNGSSIRVEPGLWSGGGFDNTAFAERKIYEGTAGDTAVGTGTLRTTLTGATWTWTAAGLTPGNVLWVDVTVTNSAGSTTERAGPYTIV